MQKALLLSVVAIGLALPAVGTKKPKPPVKAEIVSQAEERCFKQWDTANAHMRTLSELESVIISKQSMLEQGFQTPGLAQDIAEAQAKRNRILRRVADPGETGIYSDLSKWKYTSNTKNIAGGYAWAGPTRNPLPLGSSVPSETGAYRPFPFQPSAGYRPSPRLHFTPNNGRLLPQ